MRDDQFSRLMVLLGIIALLLVCNLLVSPLGMSFLGGVLLGVGGG